MQYVIVSTCLWPNQKHNGGELITGEATYENNSFRIVCISICCYSSETEFNQIMIYMSVITLSLHFCIGENHWHFIDFFVIISNDFVLIFSNYLSILCCNTINLHLVDHIFELCTYVLRKMFVESSEFDFVKYTTSAPSSLQIFYWCIFVLRSLS